MLERGFWLYVWRIDTPKGEYLYVGRTGDSSSPHANPPFTRMGQHLGGRKESNALRRNLRSVGVEAEDCREFDLIAHGPIYPEVEPQPGDTREALMKRHDPLKNEVGAMEKALAEALSDAGYRVLNTVHSRQDYREEVWREVKAAFGEHFPEMS